MSAAAETQLADPADFQQTLNGAAVDLYTLRSDSGLVAQITNYGGRVVNLFVPDADGRTANVVLGFNTLDGYLNATERFYGAIIGRYGNRIGDARFALDGTEYPLVANDGINHLHGGPDGFDRVVWSAEQPDGQTLVLTYTSPDMEEGYPGTLETTVIYRLTGKTLRVEYEATTDKPTVVNLTHHSFFNLEGAGSGTINDHVLQIDATHYTPVDVGLVPTGPILPVEGTPMDFRTPTPIGARLKQVDEQLRFGRGYDHNWVLRSRVGASEGELRLAARVTAPVSGRTMEVHTNEPGMQFYGGNFFNGQDVGASGQPHRYRESFALETQHYPDSPNKPQFPSTVLRPGETYRSVCEYRFAW